MQQNGVASFFVFVGGLLLQLIELLVSCFDLKCLLFFSPYANLFLVFFVGEPVVQLLYFLVS